MPSVHTFRVVPNLPERLLPLGVLVRNLWWTWNPEAAHLLRRMDPDEWDTYAWFRDRSPFAKAGYSIFLHQVEPTGPPVDVVLSGLQVDEFAPETFTAFGSNDVRLRWFDARTSLVVPSQPGWYAAPRNQVFYEKPGLSRRPCTTTAGPAITWPGLRASRS